MEVSDREQLEAVAALAPLWASACGFLSSSLLLAGINYFQKRQALQEAIENPGRDDEDEEAGAGTSRWKFWKHKKNKQEQVAETEAEEPSGVKAAVARVMDFSCCGITIPIAIKIVMLVSSFIGIGTMYTKVADALPEGSSWLRFRLMALLFVNGSTGKDLMLLVLEPMAMAGFVRKCTDTVRGMVAKVLVGLDPKQSVASQMKPSCGCSEYKLTSLPYVVLHTLGSWLLQLIMLLHFVVFLIAFTLPGAVCMVWLFFVAAVAHWLIRRLSRSGDDDKRSSGWLTFISLKLSLFVSYLLLQILTTAFVFWVSGDAYGEALKHAIDRPTDTWLDAIGLADVFTYDYWNNVIGMFVL
ncbi:MAG: hypothetical protein MHM6MM_009057 [Cercozoa sp. M6MM]